MTLREQLLAVRAIVVDADPRPNKCGCLEDAICRVTWGRAWSPGFAEELGIDFITQAQGFELQQLPIYKLLKKTARYFGIYLFMWNDEHSKAERLALIDHALDDEAYERQLADFKPAC